MYSDSESSEFFRGTSMVDSVSDSFGHACGQRQI